MDKKQDYSFGKSSCQVLSMADERLQRVAQRALSFNQMDFSVIESFRTLERQKRLFDSRKSKIDGVTKKGKHNFKPSLAIDILPFPNEVNGVNVWEDRQRFCVLAGLMYAAASIEGVSIRWGGDWSGNGNNADSNFHDLPHFEIRGA